MCSDGWSNADAEVVCRQHGYGYARAVSYGFYTPTEEAEANGHWIKHLECEGNETTLLECPSSPLGSSCSVHRNAGIICWKGKVRSYECRSL